MDERDQCEEEDRAPEGFGHQFSPAAVAALLAG
jgi:hypothetical protein